MFSSLLQYLCLAPSFTNVLNVYAFCNLHDVRSFKGTSTGFIALTLLQVSWGTKGSDKADALPSVSSSKSADAAPVVEDMTKAQADVDAAFKETVTRALKKVVTKEVVEKPTPDDQNKTFRTRLVAFWMLSNATLAVAIENLNGLQTVADAQLDANELRAKQNLYFGVILYSTFGLAAVRFTGVCCLGVI
jgi:chitin synthase